MEGLSISEAVSQELQIMFPVFPEPKFVKSIFSPRRKVAENQPKMQYKCIPWKVWGHSMLYLNAGLEANN